MTGILPPNHEYEQNELNDLEFCKCGVAKRLHPTMSHQLSKSNEFKERMRELLDNPRTGLKPSSNTNKTRMELLGMIDELIEAKDAETKKAVEGAYKIIKLRVDYNRRKNIPAEETVQDIYDSIELKLTPPEVTN